MPDRIFTLREWQRIKKDIFDDFFDQHNAEHDLNDLVKAGILGGSNEGVPLDSDILEGAV